MFTFIYIKKSEIPSDGIYTDREICSIVSLTLFRLNVTLILLMNSSANSGYVFNVSFNTESSILLISQ